MSVGRYPNYRGTSQDYGDETYRRYYFAPLEKPAEAPETPAASEDVRDLLDSLPALIERLEDGEQCVDALDGEGGAIEWMRRAADLLRAPRGEGEAEALAALVVRIWTRCQNEGPHYRETDEFWADFERAYRLAATARRGEGGGDGD